MALSVLILTGQSGSGKSTVVHALEDRGYFCVDNLPPGLVEKLISLAESEGTSRRLALVMDVRAPRFVEEAPALVARLREGPHQVRLLYLEAREDVLLRRYSETRRKHPLDEGAGLRAAIGREREVLATLRALADERLDTSAMTPHELRARIGERIAGSEAGGSLRIALVSFGFKHGLPADADIVLDVRFLPNPYFESDMRERTGLDPKVRDYVLAASAAQAFLTQAENFLGFLIPHYQREGKCYLTVAVGCTGGQHRSVTVAGELRDRLRRQGHQIDLHHRDIEETTT